MNVCVLLWDRAKAVSTPSRDVEDVVKEVPEVTHSALTPTCLDRGVLPETGRAWHLG